MMTDPIADMLTRMRNAIAVQHERVQMPSSRMKLAIAGLLKQEGYIQDFGTQAQSHPQDLLEIVLKYDAGSRSVIHGLRKISTPGKRKYVACKAMPRVLEGAGIAIISTSRGLMTDRQCIAENVGGEVVCYVW